MSAAVTARRFSYSVLMRLGSLYRAALSASELAIDNTLPRGLTVERRIATRARSSSLAVTGSARTLAISSEIRPSTSSAVLPGRTMASMLKVEGPGKTAEEVDGLISEEIAK